jgi:hypothetical protein
MLRWDTGQRWLGMAFVVKPRSNKCNIPEELNLYQHRCDNLKSCKEVEVKTQLYVLYTK